MLPKKVNAHNVHNMSTKKHFLSIPLLCNDFTSFYHVQSTACQHVNQACTPNPIAIMIMSTVYVQTHPILSTTAAAWITIQFKIIQIACITIEIYSRHALHQTHLLPVCRSLLSGKPASENFSRSVMYPVLLGSRYINACTPTNRTKTCPWICSAVYSLQWTCVCVCACFLSEWIKGKHKGPPPHAEFWTCFPGQDGLHTGTNGEHLGRLPECWSPKA